MTSGERAGVVLLALFASALANVAWLDGLAGTRGGPRLTGFHTLNSEDTPTYYAWIDQARRGRVRFAQLYTPEPHAPALVNPVMSAAGALAAATGLSNAGAFHALRVLLGLLLAPVVYAFLAACLPTPRERLLGLGVFLLAGGLGWIYPLAGGAPGSWPIDLWMPEAFGFLSLVESPLNLASFALWAGLALLLLRGLAFGGAARLVGCTGVAALLVLTRPYAAANVCAVAVLACGSVVALGRVPARRAAAVAGSILAGVGLGLIPALAALGSPAFGAWGAASRVPAPGVAAVVLGLAGPGALALLGVREVGRRGSLAAPLLAAWIAADALLLFAPVGPQVPFARKMLEGVSLPLAALAGAGAARLLTPGAGRTARVALLAGAAAVSLPSNAVLLRRDARAFASGALPYRLPACLAEGLDRLRAATGPEDVVLAPRAVATLIPAFAGRPIVCCHRDQTIEPERKAAEVDAFFAAGPAPRQELLARYRVRFVVFGAEGPLPRDLETTLDPLAETACLRIYAVGGQIPRGPD